MSTTNNTQQQTKQNKTTTTAWLITKRDAVLLVNCNTWLRANVPSARALAKRLLMDSKQIDPILHRHVAAYSTGQHPDATRLLLAKNRGELPPLPPFESANVCSTCAGDDVCVTLCGEWEEYCVRCSAEKLTTLLSSHDGRNVSNIQAKVAVQYPSYGDVAQLVYNVEYIADVVQHADDDDEEDHTSQPTRVYGVVIEKVTATSLRYALNGSPLLKNKVLRAMYKQTLNTNLSLTSVLFHVMMRKGEPGVLYLSMFLIGNEIIIKAGLTTLSVEERFQKISDEILVAVEYSTPHPVEVHPPYDLYIKKAEKDDYDIAVKCCSMLELERRALGLTKRYYPLANFAGSSECVWGMVFSEKERQSAIDRGHVIFSGLQRTIAGWFVHAQNVDLSPKKTAKK